ncbi:MAG: hypothetical protein KF884_07255 [Fimbriimonadaceae bacterium]|nr:hypothetical protein [Fimbriimonadaceae bacterium]QYK57346.1 MAG: hypothetical protein KF884_07255 [Fimbriimonadaceae bacterium]
MSSKEPDTNEPSGLAEQSLEISLAFERALSSNRSESIHEARKAFGDEAVDKAIYEELARTTDPVQGEYDLLSPVEERLIWLAGSKAPLRTDLLIEVFERPTSSEGVQWRVLNRFQMSKAPGACDWLLGLVEDAGLDEFLRVHALEAAAASGCRPERLAELAWGFMPDWPLHVADVLTLVGGPEDLPRLEATVAEYVESKKVRGEGRPAFMRTPGRLRRRLEREAAKRAGKPGKRGE